ncbi:LOW QUALITY PROTEIN: retrovirus-related Pol polyprotein from transposon 17.6 [Elysia marginata]|uniref:Retrovirus-related Pol polyprotein from transposon 17.6 n=1 Tax=Elysia marginata TaxID=1093978 RepID=A0AAV4FPV9_9GAST|nr:LOW QUALITY PROTEIN: retrovirus-related Pol polyprotein from transposon 17.6 [Elysia marginata]
MIISGKTDQEHHDNLYRVLQRPEEHGLRANYEKCSFYQDQVVFCGIKVTKDGLHKTSDKFKAIQDAPLSCNKTQLLPRSRELLSQVVTEYCPDCQTTLRPT